MAVHFDNLPRCGVLAMSSGKRLPTSMPNELTAMAMPLRSALKGRQGPASMALNARKPSTVKRHSASLPPASTRRARPCCNSRAPSAIALADELHAVLMVVVKPCAPTASATARVCAYTGCSSAIAARSIRPLRQSSKRSSLRSMPPTVLALITAVSRGSAVPAIASFAAKRASRAVRERGRGENLPSIRDSSTALSAPTSPKGCSP